MELAVVRYPKLITVNEYHIKEFRDDFIKYYCMICGWKWVDGAPTDLDLIDMLEEYCCQAASLDEYSDRDFYRTLETDRELDNFYALVAMEYRADFSADVRLMGESQHLFFYSNEEMKYINTPVKEIW